MSQQDIATIFEWIAPNRDRALITLGERSLYVITKVKEGYMPAFEGEEKYRGLPYVEAHCFRICYKG